MTLVQNIKTFIKSHSIQGTKATWGLFVLFAGMIFISVVASTWFIFHYMCFSTLWRAPHVFWGFWLPKICISLFLAFFVLITKRKWWTLVLFGVINLWALANLIYSHVNGLLLDWDTIMMAGNLSGFGSSIGVYWDWQAWFYIIITFLYGLLVLFFQPKPIGTTKWVVLAIILITYFGGAQCYKKTSFEALKSEWSYYTPFYFDPQDLYPGDWESTWGYVKKHSIVSYIPTMFIIAIEDATRAKEPIQFTVEEENILATIVGDKREQNIIPKYSIVFVLVESLETWALEITDNEGDYYCPNFHYLSQTTNVLYANHLVSQDRRGTSGDGQMINVTGLLPIEKGAACMLYGKNTYPSFAHLYDNAILLNPCHSMVWNQASVSPRYGFEKHLSSTPNKKDAEIFKQLAEELTSLQDSLFCCLTITMDSHSPFKTVPRNPMLAFGVDMPQLMQDYLNAIHYTDSCFGVWYNHWIETPQAQNTILVVTGDHTFFKKSMIVPMNDYLQKIGLSIAGGTSYVPLMIYSPDGNHSHITDIAYQMDVYPTIMHLIGCEDYYWKGFGVNLLDSTARHNRPITEEQAYQLSDKLIRADYFRELQQ